MNLWFCIFSWMLFLKKIINLTLDRSFWLILFLGSSFLCSMKIIFLCIDMSIRSWCFYKYCLTFFMGAASLFCYLEYFLKFSHWREETLVKIKSNIWLSKSAYIHLYKWLYRSQESGKLKLIFCISRFYYVYLKYDKYYNQKPSG